MVIFVGTCWDFPIFRPKFPFPQNRNFPSRYGITVAYNDDMEPCGKCSVAIDSAFTLVTTAEFLADPTPQDLQELYEATTTTVDVRGGRNGWPGVLHHGWDMIIIYHNVM